MICLIHLCTVYPVVFIYNLCFVLSFFFSIFIPFRFTFPFLDFVGISSANPHETSLVHLGEPSSLKGLLHMLNTTVIPTTVSWALEFCFLFCSRMSKS